MSEDSENDIIEDVIDFFHLILKGILCGVGSGSAIMRRPLLIKKRLYPERGHEYLVNEFVNCLKNKIVDGDIVLLPAKLFAIAQKKMLPESFFNRYGIHSRMNKKEMNKLIKEAKKEYNMKIDALDVLGSDSHFVKGEYRSMVPDNPNRIAYEIAREIFKKLRTKVDVMITDTVNVLACRNFSIAGMPSLLGMPIGATKGISSYNAIRSSVAAEIARNSGKYTPIVILKSEKGFERKDKHIGKFRYEGRMKIEKEKNVMEFLINIMNHFKNKY